MTVRSWLDQCVPSPAAFGLLLHLVETGACELTLEELEASLAAWPDACRVIPIDRLPSFEEGTAPWIPLVRALSYRGVGLPKKRLDHLMGSPHLDAISTLDLRSCRLKWEQQAALIDRFPSLRSIALGRSTTAADLPTIESLFGSPALARVEALSFRGWDKIKKDVYELLIRAFPLENLRTLDLGGHGKVVNAKAMTALVRGGRLTNLRCLLLDIGNNDKWHKGMLKAMATGPGLPELRVLALDGVKDLALLDAPAYANLERLALYVSTAPPASLARLVRSPHLHALQHLRVTVDDEHASGLTALTDPSNLPALQSLELTCNATLSSGLGDLLRSERFARLRRVGLSTTADNSAGVLGALAEHPVFSRLEGLSLGSHDGTSADKPTPEEIDALRALYSAKRFPILTDLVVRGVRHAADESFAVLAVSSLAPNLRWLRLGAQSNSTLDHLWMSAAFTALEHLDLTPGCARLEPLAASPHLPALRAVHVPERSASPSVLGREVGHPVGVRPMFTNHYVDHGEWFQQTRRNSP